MKVRATQDGHYGGYYRYGPKEQEDGTMAPGDVFEIDASPHEVKDEAGRPLQEMIATGELDAKGYPVMKPVWVTDGNGKPKRDTHGQLMAKIKMVTAFSPEWMEPVNADADVTNPDLAKPMPILKEYLPKKMAAAASAPTRTIDLPPEVAAAAGVGPKAESPL